MKRAFLFGITVQLILIGALFLFFGDLMRAHDAVAGHRRHRIVPGRRERLFRLKGDPSSAWPVRIGMWIAGFLAIYVAIPFIELAGVLIIPRVSG